MNIPKAFRTIFLAPAGFQAAPRSVALALLLLLAVLASAASSASAQAVNFGSVNVCQPDTTTPSPCAANKTVTFDIPAGTTIGSIAIVTTGIADLDFKAKADDTSTTLCKATTYSSSSTCTVDVTFAPFAAGLRKGAVQLKDGAAVLATTYIYGTGVGPQVGFSPQSTLLLGTGLSAYAMAIDAAGDLFLSNTAGTIVEVFAAGGYTKTKTIPLDTSFGSPLGIAVDGAGNLFVTTYGGGDGVYEISAASGYTSVKTLLSPGAGNSLAVDGSGNVFFTDGGVKEILAAGGYTTVKTLVRSEKSNFISDITLDANGNIFAVGYIIGSGGTGDGSATVQEFVAAGGYVTVKNFGIFSTDPSGITVDAAENVYFAIEVSTGGPSSIYELVAAGGYSTINTLNNPIHNNPDGVNGIEAMALDGDGNLFVFGSDAGELAEVVRSQSPALAFPNTVVGSVSNSQTVTLQNIGNAALAASNIALTDAVNFPLVAGSGTPQECAGTFSLSPSVECRLSIEFNPQSYGFLAGSLVVTDNAVNTTAATQTIALSGTGASAASAQVSPSSLQFGSVAYPGSATRPLTITNTGTATLTVNPSSNGPSVVIAGSTCGAGVAPGKSCVLQVEFKPVQLGSHVDIVTIATNATVSPTVHVTGTATGVGSLSTVLDFGTVTGYFPKETMALTVTNYGVPGNVTVSTSTGATSFKVISNGCATGVTAGSSCTIQVEYEPAEEGSQTAYLKLIPSTGPQQFIKMRGTFVRTPCARCTLSMFRTIPQEAIASSRE